MSYRVGSSVLLAVVCALLDFTPLDFNRTAHAQNVFRQYSPDLAGGFIEPPRAVRQQLEESEQAIEEERYSDAVLGLGKLLQRSADASNSDDVAGQDFFLDAGLDNLDAIAIESLLRRAEDLLGRLPDKGLDIYELNYGAAAKRAFEEAAVGPDWVALKDVVRRYFHTPAGYQAAYLWGYHELQTGRPLAAARLFQRLAAQRRAASVLGGQLDAALALSLKLAEREESQVRAALRNVPADPAAPARADRYRLADQDVPAPASGDELAWLEKHFPPLQRTTPPPPVDYPVAGGDPSRALSEGGQTPLSASRWKVETTTGSVETEELRTTAQSLASQGELPPPTWLPLRVGDQLLMRTTERLMGVDFETGKRVWEYPWESSTGEPEQLPFDEEELSSSLLLKQRVWFDLPYGRMSSDEERVYLLDNLAQIETNRRFTPFGRQPIQRGVAQRKNTGANTLVALKLKSQGKLLWRVGVGEEVPTIFSDAFFLGPPLPIDGRLYVMAELAGDICLLCLDPDTGSLLWRQQILAIETGDIESDVVRRVSGSMPAYQDGVLVCPTGAGAIVAVDLASRSLLWGTKYRRSNELDNAVAGRGNFDPTRLMQRWHDGTPQIVDGAVYVTPLESDRLYAFDLLTGEPRFPEIQRSGMRYLAGVRDQQVILVGNREVHAYDTGTGRRNWTATVNDTGQNAQVAGTGVFGGNLFFVPLTNRQIASIDLAKGDVVHRQTMDFELGNLLQAGGQLISQSPTEVAVAFGQQWLRPTVDQRLTENPEDLWAIKRKAQLLIEDGQRDEALEWLAKARRLSVTDEEVRSLSVSAMLGALQDDFVAQTDLLEPLQGLVRFPDRQAELLSLMARNSVRRGKHVQAIQELIELSSLVANEPELTSQVRQLQRNDKNALPSLDTWIAGQASQAWQAAEENERQPMNQAVDLHLQRFQGNSTNSLQRLSSHFAALPGADAARFALIMRLLKEGDQVRAERLATEALQSVNDPLRAAPFRLALANVYQAASFKEDVRLQLEQLAGDQSETLSPAQQEILATLRDSYLPEQETTWPPYVVTKWNAPQGQRTSRTTNPDLLDVLARSGQHLRGMQVITEEGKTISLRDPLGRVTAIPMAVPNTGNDGARTVVIDGGVMVALMPTELVAVSLLEATNGSRDAIMWRHPWRSELGGRMARTGSMATPFGDNHKLYEITDPLRRAPNGEYRLGPLRGNSLYVLNAGELQAFNVLRGSTQWTNSGAPPTGHIVATEDRLAVASPDTDAGRIDFFNAIDGQKVDTQPWPENERIWFASGPHLLTYEVAAGNVPSVVQLRNVFEDKVLLRKELAPPETAGVTTKGHIAEGRWLTLLQPTGEITVWDLREGREVGTHSVGPIEKLNGLQVILRDDHLILLPETSVRPEKAPNTVDPEVAQGRIVSRVHGPLVCMHQTTGDILWETPLEDGPWGCTTGQATGSPLLVFSRAQAIYSPTSTSTRRKELSLLAVDVKTGKIMARRTGLKLPSFNSDIATNLNVDPEQHVVAAMVSASFMQFNYSDTEPPAQPEEEPEADEAPAEEAPAEPFDLFR